MKQNSNKKPIKDNWDSSEGTTHYCTHREDHDLGNCHICLPRKKALADSDKEAKLLNKIVDEKLLEAYDDSDKEIPNNWEKELKDIIARRESKMYGYYKSIFVDDFEGGYPIEYDEELQEFIKTLLEKEREKYYGRIINVFASKYEGIERTNSVIENAILNCFNDENFEPKEE